MRDIASDEVLIDLQNETLRLEADYIAHAGRVLDALTQPARGPQPTTIPIRIHGSWQDAVRSGRERSRE